MTQFIVLNTMSKLNKRIQDMDEKINSLDSENCHLKTLVYQMKSENNLITNDLTQFKHDIKTINIDLAVHIINISLFLPLYVHVHNVHVCRNGNCQYF